MISRNRTGSKQKGFIVSTEMVLIATMLVIGMTVGLVTLRDALTAEFEDTAEAIGSLDQSYSFQGLVAGTGVVALAGSSFGDAVDTLAGDELEFTFEPLDQTEGTAAILPSFGSSSAANGGSTVGVQ